MSVQASADAILVSQSIANLRHLPLPAEGALTAAGEVIVGSIVCSYRRQIFFQFHSPTTCG